MRNTVLYLSATDITKDLSTYSTVKAAGMLVKAVAGGLCFNLHRPQSGKGSMREVD